MSQLFPLRPVQQKALDGLRDSLRTGHRRPIIAMPTGAGKTVLAAHVVHGAMVKSKRVAFVVPLLNLIDQTFTRFRENGIDAGDMGVVQGDHPWRRPHAPVQICSIQTIGARGNPNVDFVVVDEVHLRFKALDEWMAAEPGKIFVGLSATPWARGLADHWDDLISPTTIAELITLGNLSPFKVFAPSHPDLSGVKLVAGDYHEGQLSERMSSKTLVGDVVQTWLSRAEGRRTLVFAVDRAHAQLLFDEFSHEGVRCAYVDANTPREERAELGKALNNGGLDVIVSIGTMTTGVDLDIRCIVLARPTKSEMLFVQQIGRGLRPAEGKDHCLVLDHSDSHLRLGMVTDIHHDQLFGGGGASAVAPIERQPSKPLECPKCSCLMPAGSRECASCGFAFPRRPSTVVEQAGELVELELVRAKRVQGKLNRELTWPEKEALLGELKGFAREKGYKDGWAANKYREKTGVWPNDPRVKYASARSPSAGTRSWIKSSQIRWAKSKSRTTDEIVRDSVSGIE